MPRILLAHQPIDGGVGRHVADLAAGLSQRGFEVTLCGPAPPIALADVQERVSHVPLRLRREVDLAADARAARRFAAIVREIEPDVIHAHSSKAGVVARLARATRMRTPLLYTPHLYSFASSFAGGPRRIAYREIERALSPLASRVVCVCEQEARLARTIGPASRVRVVYNGVAAAPADVAAETHMERLSKQGPVLCAISLLHPRKGLASLIDVAPAILARHPSAQIAIWGDGPDLRHLQAHADELRVAHAVHFLGLCSDPVATLAGADVFVHPALAEAFPYVILEAMSAGRLIVASDVGGIGEAIADGRSGVLVQPGDSASLANALIDLLDDPDRRATMGAQALRRFEERFTLGQMLDKLVAVYEELLP